VAQALSASEQSAQDLSGLPRIDAGGPVVVVLHGFVNQSVGASQQRSAFTGCRNECRNVDQMPDSLQASDD
jgi:hypothetical protein